MNLTTEQLTAVVLAGGKGSRMGGQDKGLMRLWDKPLVGHVLERLTPQVPRIVISANRHPAEYAALGYPVISDTRSEFAGPLAGIAATLAQSRGDWLITAACDTPFLPPDYVTRLCAKVSTTQIHVVRIHDQLQPTFALWPREELAALERYLDRGERAVHGFMRQRQAVSVDFTDLEPSFININSTTQLHSFNAHVPAAIGPRCPVLGIVAYSGTGKTQLLKQLIPLFSARGWRIGIIKHAHHQFDIDHPGKDSYELRHAGATQVLVASQRRWALMTETPQQSHDPVLNTLLAQLDSTQLDLILVEGFKHAAFPKIELHRPSLSHPLLCHSDADIIAVATDATNQLDINKPVLPLNQPEQIVEFILQTLPDLHRRPALR